MRNGSERNSSHWDDRCLDRRLVEPSRLLCAYPPPEAVHHIGSLSHRFPFSQSAQTPPGLQTVTCISTTTGEVKLCTLLHGFRSGTSPVSRLKTPRPYPVVFSGVVSCLAGRMGDFRLSGRVMGESGIFGSVQSLAVSFGPSRRPSQSVTDCDSGLVLGFSRLGPWVGLVSLARRISSTS